MVCYEEKRFLQCIVIIVAISVETGTKTPIITVIIPKHNEIDDLADGINTLIP